MEQTTQTWSGLTEAVEARRAADRSVGYTLSYADVLEILRVVDSTPNIGELKLTINDLDIEIVRGAPGGVPVAATAAPVSASIPAPSPVAAPQAPSAGPAAVAPPGSLAVKAPIAGIFYTAPSPGAAPFVAVGSLVDEDTVIGIIEVMKVMNNVKAGVRGIVKDVCAPNEELVQFDQTLLYVRPADTPSA